MVGSPGGQLLAPRMSSSRTWRYGDSFGRGTGLHKSKTKVGIPVNVEPRKDLAEELMYGKHRGAKR